MYDVMDLIETTAKIVEGVKVILTNKQVKIGDNTYCVFKDRIWRIIHHPINESEIIIQRYNEKLKVNVNSVLFIVNRIKIELNE